MGSGVLILAGRVQTLGGGRGQAGGPGWPLGKPHSPTTSSSFHQQGWTHTVRLPGEPSQATGASSAPPSLKASSELVSPVPLSGQLRSEQTLTHPLRSGLYWPQGLGVGSKANWVQALPSRC